MSRGELGEAREHVREMLSYVEAYPTLPSTDDPMRAYLTCYRVLRAAQDARSDQILDTAYHTLQALAAKLDEEELRRSYLENVAEHRAITTEYETTRPG
jgi:hypothetical protein